MREYLSAEVRIHSDSGTATCSARMWKEPREGISTWGGSLIDSDLWDAFNGRRPVVLEMPDGRRSQISIDRADPLRGGGEFTGSGAPPF